MPSFATVNAKLNCWNCEGQIDTAVSIQWGKVPSHYQLGDPIEWFEIEGVVVPPFLQVGCQSYWNFGDAQVTSLLVLDQYIYSSNAIEAPKCLICDKPIELAAVHIEGNVVVSVNAYSKQGFNEMLGFTRASTREEIFVLRNDGRYEAREEWYDHPIKYVEDFP